MKMPNEYTKKFARHMATETEALLVEHLESAVEAAQDSESDKAAITIKLTWPLDTASPTVKTVVTYTTAHKDEAESVFDPNQTKLEGIE